MTLLPKVNVLNLKIQKMSNYTSIILFIPPTEIVNERINEVNSYILEDGRKFGMVDVNQSPYPDIFPRVILCGSYNHFDLDRFIKFLRERVNWKYPNNIKLLAQNDYSEHVELYNIAGQ
jgi:hypothetical protein